MGPMGSPKTSVLNHPAPSKTPEDGRIQFNRGISLPSRIVHFYEVATLHLVQKFEGSPSALQEPRHHMPFPPIPPPHPSGASSWTAWPLKYGLYSPETSVSNHFTPRNNPEVAGIHFKRVGSLRSRRINFCPRACTKCEKWFVSVCWMWHKICRWTRISVLVWHKLLQHASFAWHAVFTYGDYIRRSNEDIAETESKLNVVFALRCPLITIKTT